MTSELVEDGSFYLWIEGGSNSLAITDQNIAIEIMLGPEQFDRIRADEEIKPELDWLSDDPLGVLHDEIACMTETLLKEGVRSIVDLRIKFDVVLHDLFIEDLKILGISDEDRIQVLRKSRSSRCINISNGSFLLLPLLVVGGVVITDELVPKEAAKNQTSCRNDSFGHLAHELVPDFIQLDLDGAQTGMSSAHLDSNS